MSKVDSIDKIQILSITTIIVITGYQLSVIKELIEEITKLEIAVETGSLYIEYIDINDDIKKTIEVKKEL